jgi:hypothetical protein
MKKGAATFLEEHDLPVLPPKEHARELGDDLRVALRKQ